MMIFVQFLLCMVQFCIRFFGASSHCVVCFFLSVVFFTVSLFSLNTGGHHTCKCTHNDRHSHQHNRSLSISPFILMARQSKRLFIFFQRMHVHQCWIHLLFHTIDSNDQFEFILSCTSFGEFFSLWKSINWNLNKTTNFTIASYRMKMCCFRVCALSSSDDHVLDSNKLELLVQMQRFDIHSINEYTNKTFFYWYQYQAPTESVDFFRVGFSFTFMLRVCVWC